MKHLFKYRRDAAPGKRVMRVRVDFFVDEEDVAGILAVAGLDCDRPTPKQVREAVQSYCWAEGNPGLKCEPEWDEEDPQVLEMIADHLRTLP